MAIFSSYLEIFWLHFSWPAGVQVISHYNSRCLYLVTTLSSSTWVSSPLVVEVETKLLRSPPTDDDASDSGAAAVVTTGGGTISLAAAQFLT